MARWHMHDDGHRLQVPIISSQRLEGQPIDSTHPTMNPSLNQTSKPIKQSISLSSVLLQIYSVLYSTPLHSTPHSAVLHPSRQSYQEPSIDRPCTETARPRQHVTRPRQQQRRKVRIRIMTIRIRIRIGIQKGLCSVPPPSSQDTRITSGSVTSAHSVTGSTATTTTTMTITTATTMINDMGS